MSWKKARSSEARRRSTLTSRKVSRVKASLSSVRGMARTCSSTSRSTPSSSSVSEQSRSSGRSRALAATMAAAAPQQAQALEVPQPPGASAAWAQWSASPGRRPSASLGLTAFMVRSQAPLTATTWRWPLRTASGSPQQRSRASTIWLEATAVTCAPSSSSEARSAGRNQVERFGLAIAMPGLPPEERRRIGAPPRA